jgi:CheY-like chemotaxis protein
VTTIRESGKHLLCLITDILDISKIQAGKLELSTATLGIQAVCDSVIEMVKTQAEEQNIALTATNNVPFDTFQGDPLRMKQILLNLLGNAIKFTPEGGQVGLEVMTDETTNSIQFRVWDTGPGIASSNANSIFKPFVQASGHHTRTQPGTGLGLSIARHLAKLHDGELTLERFDVPGAVFHLKMPIGENHSEPEFDFRATGSWDLPTEPLEDEPLNQEVEKVLIAEDTDSNYQHLHDMLVSLGYSVDRAINGQEAIELCASLKPDLILMDIDMPYVNGLDAIRVIRQTPEHASLPIIAVTAMSGVAEEQACLAAGANAFLAKPYPLRDLMMKMQQVAQ